MVFLSSVSWCYLWRDKHSHACGAKSTLAFAIVDRYNFFRPVRRTWVMLLTGGGSMFSACGDVLYLHGVRLNQICPSASALWSSNCFFPSCSFSFQLANIYIAELISWVSMFGINWCNLLLLWKLRPFSLPWYVLSMHFQLKYINPSCVACGATRVLTFSQLGALITGIEKNAHSLV